ncbi:sce7726 family protein [Pseudomonas lini]|nr:sce7726 family protein [Pseudomonas lini]
MDEPFLASLWNHMTHRFQRGEKLYSCAMHNPDHIRELLKKWVAKTMPHGEGDVFIGELCFINKARRADLVHANGQLTAFEIKSASDSLSRWEGQQDAYLSCFDQVWLCCHSKHIEKAFGVTHRSVGILVVDDLGSIAVVRKATHNKLRDKFTLTGLLWRSELDEICKEFQLETKSTMRIKEVRLEVTEALEWELIRDKVLSRLKVRYSVGQNMSSMDTLSPSSSS